MRMVMKFLEKLTKRKEKSGKGRIDMAGIYKEWVYES
jgi:hypothetical protein